MNICTYTGSVALNNVRISDWIPPRIAILCLFIAMSRKFVALYFRVVIDCW